MLQCVIISSSSSSITKQIKENSTKTKVSVNDNSIIASLPTYTIIEKKNSNDEKMKLKHFKKVFSHDRIIAALNTDKDKYMNYKTSTNDDTIGNACEDCHDSDRLNFFGLPKKFNVTDSGYPRIKSPKMIVLKDKACQKVIVDKE